MKFLILSENSNGAWPYLYYRSMGAFELRRRIENKGHKAEIIEWFTYWSHDELKDVMDNFFYGEDNPIIAISTPFNTTDIHRIKYLLLQAKEKYTNLKIIHGGSRTFDSSLNNIVDIFFLGRSMQMFDAWLEGKDLSSYTKKTNPLVLVNNNFDEKIDNPVIPVLKDSDLLIDKDILGFEVGVGCRFNCTFCNYELRNSKISKLMDPYELRNYLDIAYRKYGITNYFASDDTLNESDEKLEIVADAISGLNYHPNISAFARLDIINARPSQLELIKRIKFKSLFFGIESFNQEASKLVRKKSGLYNNYDTLLNIKNASPETYTVGGLIIGLNKDSEESIRESTKRIIDEKLLNSIQLYPLTLSGTNTITSVDYLSEIELFPEKYNYKITNAEYFHHKNKQVPVYHWESDWTNSKNAELLKNNLEDEFKDSIDLYGHLEYAGFSALGLIKKDKKLKYEQLRNQSYNVSTQLKKLYVSKKKQLFIKKA